MEQSLKRLEIQRQALYRQIEGLGDFRPGMISVNYRKCGKKNCACQQKDHPGHGPQYLWNTTQNGKSRAQNLRPGPEMEKVRNEVETHKKFNQLCRDVIAVNEQICRQRPVPQIEDETELTALKKKLRRRFFRKLKKKSAG
jgi:hypothetical protein